MADLEEECFGDADAATRKAAAESVDCAGACLAPGLIDMRVQSADPGAEHLEDLSTLLRAAASGGITSVVALPDVSPVVDDASMIDPAWLNSAKHVGVTAGASAPELLVQEVITTLQAHGGLSVRDLDGREENITFSLPKGLRIPTVSVE